MHNAPTPPADDAGELAPWEIELANAIVSGFVATRPWLREERNDLVQDCLEQWLRRRADYDASRGASAKTFMRRVLERHLVDLERARTAEKRGSGDSPVSLYEEDDAQDRLHDLVANGEDTERAAVWAVAFDRARARLAPEERVILEALLQGHRMTDLPQVTGRARSTLYLELQRVRDAFRDEGLDGFV